MSELTIGEMPITPTGLSHEKKKYYWEEGPFSSESPMDLGRVESEIRGMSDEEVKQAVLAINHSSPHLMSGGGEKRKKGKSADAAVQKAVLKAYMDAVARGEI